MPTACGRHGGNVRAFGTPLLPPPDKILSARLIGSTRERGGHCGGGIRKPLTCAPIDRGVKDLIFGNTINGVRHEVSAPVRWWATRPES
jgi:hypothetical protein